MSYSIRFVSSLAEIDAACWDGLLAASSADPASPGTHNPFLRHAFLHALHESGSACAETGWIPHYLTLWLEPDAAEETAPTLVAAMPLYRKLHSYGEYVFDWAWADAYRRHDLDYYPKLLSAIPFTPVQGPRLLARDEAARQALLDALCQLCDATGPTRQQHSSCHILFASEPEIRLLEQRGFMLRQGVQFHWLNQGYQDFAHFLSTLEAKKRKNILAERRKVAQAGVRFEQIAGNDISLQHWHFFVRCYRQTYAEHHSSPYLNLDFFLRLARSMPENILLTMAYQNDEAIAASLLIHNQQTLYGRYWGTLRHLPCLHFETAYYQPLEFCIRQQIACFEGGAQGEHKMARGFLPQTTWSAHWLAHPVFADAVEDFLQRERSNMGQYLDELREHQPFRQQRDATRRCDEG